jgi:hypothetical protein
MTTSKPTLLQVSDLIQWYRKKELVINESFQRHSVWKPQARIYLIDTILNELPIPKIFIRSIIDPIKQTSIREVVDGQQRIKAMLDFADNKMRLSSRSENFSGLTYQELDDEKKEVFLGYTVVVEQLLNASDDDVIDVFSRINSYTVSLNEAEKRHAQYQTDFKFFVRDLSTKYRWFIEKHSVFSLRQRFRMADDTFFAEVASLFLNGVVDGGAPKLDALYKGQTDEVFTPSARKKLLSEIGDVIAYLEKNYSDVLSGNLSKHYQLLMIIAAVAYLRHDMPYGQIESPPARGALDEVSTIRNRLSELSLALDGAKVSKDLRRFVDASSGATNRIASRRIRFIVFLNAFQKAHA